MRRLVFAITFSLLTLFGTRASAQTPIVVRFAVNASGGQTELLDAIRKYNLDRKYGFDVQEVDVTAPGAQYVMLRSETADLAPGTFIDLMRQRKAGLELVAFHGFQGFNNYIVTKPQTPIRSFADLKGKRFGEFGTTFLDWLILRAAGKKAYGFDVETDTDIVQGTPPLLNDLLAKGQVDAMLQFSDLTLGPIKDGAQRMIIDVPGLMKAAGFVPDAFNSNWNINQKWIDAHPGAIKRLSAMIDEGYAKLKTDDSLWPAIAAKIGFTDPAIVVAYRTLARRIDNPPFNRSLMAPTQALLDAINAIAGKTPVGVTTLDPAAFVFPNELR
ncbi:MAG: ABC transporter substrate-binding protein [Candidatus Lustribacter sp.]|jgi:NitT/TauT family transport system substrate-binding protein